MDTARKRATIYFDQKLHRALRRKAAQMDSSVSKLVNDAVRVALAEDAEDLVAFEERRREPDLDFETVVAEMKRRGRL
ncbi:MAG TPA: CopG family transcriptional regulator [Terriglobia bacterium]|nr:CopG family transcriptional regulator [Terriglobia bacterium]